MALLATGNLHADGVKTGDAAPGFTLTDINGKTHSLADYQGKYVVLEWFNQGCPFVQKFYEPGKMQEWQREMAAQDIVWLVINSTEPKHQDYLDNAGAKKQWDKWKIAAAAMLMDSDGSVGKLYAARTTPHMYIIDPEGTLIYQGAIDSNRSSNSADIGSATNYVLASLKEAKQGKEVSNATTRPYGCSVKYAN